MYYFKHYLSSFIPSWTDFLKKNMLIQVILEIT